MNAELTVTSGIVFGAVVAIGAAMIPAGSELFHSGPWLETKGSLERMRSTIELIVTEHAHDRLNDATRFPTPPRLRVDEEFRVLQFRRTDSGEDVWMCQIEGGFLVGVLRETRRRQMLIAMTAISRPMFRKASYNRVACHRVLVDKIAVQRKGK